MMRLLGSFPMVLLAALAVALNGSAAFSASLTFHTEAPIPGPYDVYNFIGASRDGLNVNDENGLDGPLNDDFTYVANDRPRQGQSFDTPATVVGQAFSAKAVWLRTVGYTDNGVMPEAGYNGTDEDFSAGGEFTIRMFNPTFPGFSFRAIESCALTGVEANNPAPSGRITSDNGSGLWLRFAFDAPPRLSEGSPFAFDVASSGPANRLFEWLGTRDNIYGGFSGNEAFSGFQPGFGSSPTENSILRLMGDRVFLVELQLVPEPHGIAFFSIAGLAGVLIVRRRRL